MITIYDYKKTQVANNGKVTYLLELRGLSTDSKPTTIANGDIENGSSFIEIDTGDVYLYNGTSKEWSKV